MDIDNVEMSSSDKQNHPDYISPETNLQAHSVNIKNNYKTCFLNVLVVLASSKILIIISL